MIFQITNILIIIRLKSTMGIKNLNKLLKSQCKNSIQIISLSELSGKTIAIDISIYLYKYTTDNSLIENIFQMLSIFYYYQIKPIFIFDGKPPPEKKMELIKRIKDKKIAEQEYLVLKEKLDDKDICLDHDKKKDLMKSMYFLKKQFVSLKKEQIDKVKELMDSYGACYLDAPQEADELCAILVVKNKVWACLSEDTDLFVYGCPRVLRYLSLLNHTAVLYDMEKILCELGLTQDQFREICILSGTDYNSSNTHCLEKLLDLYKKFSRQCLDNKKTFYEWIALDCQINLQSINDLFNINEKKENLSGFIENMEKNSGKKCEIKMRAILEENGFLFVK